MIQYFIFNHVFQYNINNWRELIGVSSNFARVALARDWIDNQLKEATFCQNNGDADDQ